MKKFFGLLFVAGLVLTTACAGEKKADAAAAPADSAAAAPADTTKPAAADSAAAKPADAAHGSGH